MPEVTVKTAEEWRQLGLRNCANRNDDIDVGPGSYPYVIMAAVGEMLAIQSSNARTICQAIPLATQTEDQLHANFDARLPQLQESKASGYVVVSCSSSGTTIQVGDKLTSVDNKQSYITTIATATTYSNGQTCPVSSVDPGLGTNLAVGKVLTWDAIRAGCYASVEVYAMPDGSGGTKGITGGRDIESIDEWRARISDYLANPAGHGNEQDVIAMIEDTSGKTLSTGEVTTGHGVPVLKGFCYPALQSSGTLGMAFLIKQDDWWRSRAPTSTQITTVYSYVNPKFPKDSILPITVVDEALSVDLTVTLSTGAAQWADYTPWPAQATRLSGRKVVAASPAPTATVFTVATDDADYTGETSPSAGQSIGLFDYTTGSFKLKKILSVSGSGPWAITVDPVGSDTSYVPVAGRAVCPWCDALNDIATAIGKHVAAMGPGECVAGTTGDGIRQLRVPFATEKLWPQTIGQRSAFDLVNSVSAVSGATFISASPTTLPIDGRDVCNLFLLTDLGIYKA